MQHIYWIKSSQTWTCPKAGLWKVICVGAGASGGISFGNSNKASTPIQSAGGTTSFGSLLSASGGLAETNGAFSYGGSSSDCATQCGGYGGWDGINYGGTPAMASVTTTGAGATGNGGVLGRNGLGFGAGGGVGIYGIIKYKSSSSGSESNAHVRAVPGKCGQMITGEFDLTANQNISCTVGTSSKPAFNSTNVWNAIKSGISNIDSSGSLVTASFAELSNCVLAGTSGVIYLEYLG